MAARLGLSIAGYSAERPVDVAAEPETALQSRELSREIQRLRLHLGELERAATGHEGMRAGSLPPEIATTPEEPVAAHPSMFAATPALAGSQNDTSQWPVRGGRELKLAPLSTSGLSSQTYVPLHEDSSHRLAGWEYRPHSSDNLDMAIAALVNRPSGRYYRMRALLCRLEPGIYLCGSRRMHLRVGDVRGQLTGGGGGGDGAIWASSDSGGTWMDLEGALRGG